MRQEQPANQWKFVFNVTDTALGEHDLSRVRLAGQRIRRRRWRDCLRSVLDPPTAIPTQAAATRAVA